MSKDAAIILDGVTYMVPPLNIGQLEDVSEAFEGPRTTKIPFAILRIALSRATPKADLDAICPTMDEIAEAVRMILLGAGLQKPDANPPVLTVVAKD